MSKMGRYKSYLTGVQNKGGGVETTFKQCPKERRFFFWWLPLVIQWLSDPVTQWLSKPVNQWLCDLVT